MGLRYKYFVTILCAFLCVLHWSEASFNKVQHVITEKNETVLLQKWKNMEKLFRDGVQNIMRQVFPMVIKSNSELDLTPECTGAILKMIRGIQNLDQWAFLMLDAMGKPMDGIMTGSVSAFGAYDQCLETEVPDGKGGIKFRGQYCTVEFRFPLPEKPKHFYRMLEVIKPLDKYKTNNLLMNETRRYAAYFYSLAFRIGACAPSECSVNDIQQIAQSIGSMAEFNTHVKGCEVKESFHMDTTQIVILSMFVCFAVMVLMATIVDYMPEILNQSETKPSSKSFGRKLLQAFSIRENTRKLLQTESIGESTLPALHGYRFLAMTWVILGHTYLYIDWQLWQHYSKAMAIVTSIPFQIITNASPCVDSFFFLSGFLVCYLTVTSVDKRGRKVFNIPIVIFRRIWRILPASMMMVCFAILMPLIGSGPLWKENIELEATNCRKNWWVIMLFGNNIIFPTDGMCLPHLWYVSADMHLFLVSMIYLYLLFKKPKVGITFNVFFIFSGVVATAIVTYVKGLPPVPLSVNPDYFQRIEIAYLTYFATHSHTCSYGMGLMLGHFLARHREKIHFPRITLLVGWALAIVCNLTIIYVSDIWLHDRPPTTAESVAYASLYRIGWCLGLSWLVTVCVVGQGGLVNDILSWKAFIPLSRLTFITYLVHLLVIQGFYSAQRSGFETGNLLVVWYFFGFFMVSFGLAVICRMLFEGPILEVEKLIMGRIFGSKRHDEEDREEKPEENDVKLDMIIENGHSKRRSAHNHHHQNGDSSSNKRRSANGNGVAEVVLSKFQSSRNNIE